MTDPKPFEAPVKQPLRHFLLQRIGLLLTSTTLLVVGCFVWFALWPMGHRIAEDQFELAVARVQAGLQTDFEQPVHLLGMARGWLGGQAPDLESPQAFNAVFQPVLSHMHSITSVVAGTPTGQGWLLLEQGEGRWRNRMTDVPRWGNQQHRVYDHATDGSVQSRWITQHYDPRERPWYQGAMALARETDVFWSAPYTFFTTQEPGITVAARHRLTDGRTLVMGFDLKLRDISRHTLNAALGQQGLVLVMTDDERVLAVPRLPAGMNEAQWVQRVLQPASGLPLPQIGAALSHWREHDRSTSEVMDFMHHGAQWLLRVHPYTLGQQRLWVVALAPASDFAPAWNSVVLTVSLALLAVAALAMAVVGQGTRRLVKPLELLAQNSQRIGKLEFDAMVPVRSRVDEINQLVESQRQMATLLHDNQTKLDMQADELQRQVAALKHTEQRLQLQNEQLSTIINNFPGAVSVVDQDLRVVAFNAEFGQLFDLPRELLNKPGLTFADIIRYNAQRGDYGPGDPEEQVHQRVQMAHQFLPHRMERTLPNGTVIDIRGTPLPGGGFVSHYMDVTDRKRHEFELEHMAHFDALTGLPNRVLMADRLRQAMPLVQRRGYQMAVLFLDLDGFKVVNDTHGHAMGDQLLLTLAGRMKTELREGDTLARMGGDEFVALLMDMESFDSCKPVLERLLLSVALPVRIHEVEVAVSASIGVTLFPQPLEVDADQLLRQADQAMYLAKQAGKNRYHLFDAEQDFQMRGQLQNIQRLQQAFDEQEFVLYYQPKVDMRTARVVGAEALIRWQHPQRGLLSPAEFLPLIEDQPLTVTLGQWVIRTALQQIAQWKALGLHLPVSVNVGARQLQDDGFVRDLATALAEQPNVSPGDLQIEVLETSALQDMARVTGIITQCGELGVQFALDDFGTGYSSLTYLKRLPASTLKIDQSFVRDMLDDADDLSILLGVLDLAHSFHREVIAEGVETVEHGRMLLQLGCHLAQGYGIARPMPAPQLADWVTHWQGHAQWCEVAVLPRHDLPILFAMVEHRAWVHTVEAFLVGEKKSMPPLDAHQCRLGQWLDGDDALRGRDPAMVERLQALHERIHDLAACLCELKAQGQTQTLYTQIPPLIELREEILVQLTQLLGQGA